MTLLASIMRALLLRTALPAIAVLGASAAQADVYTWTDASGRLNVSNVAPPEGVHVNRVVHEDPAKVQANAIAARNAARTAEVEVLNERVAQLQDEIDRAKQQPQPPPVQAVPYRVAPPVQVTVNVMPSATPAGYGAGYAGYPGYLPYPGYPGLPHDYCDPTVFGCPPFGYPVGVVVLNTPRFDRFHRFQRFDRFGGHRVVAHPMPAAANFRRR